MIISNRFNIEFNIYFDIQFLQIIYILIDSYF